MTLTNLQKLITHGCKALDYRAFMKEMEKPANQLMLRCIEATVDEVWEVVQMMKKRENAEWIKDAEDVYWGNSLIRYECSFCHRRPFFNKEEWEFKLTPFCPHCGSPMKGADE